MDARLRAVELSQVPKSEGVKCRDILYILSPDILYSFVFQPPRWEGKWETPGVFQGGRAAVFSSLVRG
jgi:hypothetical protein